MAKILNVAHTGFIVENMEKTVDFWVNIMGGKLLDRGEDAGDALGAGVMGLSGENTYAKMLSANIEAGGHILEFFQFLEPVTAPYHGDMSKSGSAHLALYVDDIAEMYDELKAKGVVFNSEINTVKNEDGSIAFQWVYLRDPNNICTELMQMY